MNLLKKLFDHEYKELKRFSLLADNIEELDEEYKKLTDYELQAAKFVPKPTKVSPGYKKKRQAQIQDIAARLKKNDGKKKKRFYK